MTSLSEVAARIKSAGALLGTDGRALNGVPTKNDKYEALCGGCDYSDGAWRCTVIQALARREEVFDSGRCDRAMVDGETGVMSKNGRFTPGEVS